MTQLRLTLLFATCLVLVGTANGTPYARTLDDKTPCAIVEEWAIANASTLPTSLAEFGKLPMAYRRAALRHLDASAQASLWLEHLRAMRGAHQYTREQQLLIDEAERLLTEGLLARPDDIGRPILDRFEARVRQAFPRQEATDLFVTLGPPEIDLEARLDRDPIQQGLVARAGGISALAMMPQCNCSHASDWCQPYPTSPTSDCRPVTCAWASGCGLFGYYDCDGRCSGIGND